MDLSWGDGSEGKGASAPFINQAEVRAVITQSQSIDIESFIISSFILIWVVKFFCRFISHTIDYLPELFGILKIGC